MPARQFLMAVIESSYGTPKASPVLGTDSFFLRLDQDNAFTMEAAPVPVPIMYGGGTAIEAESVVDEVACAGAFAFRLYPGIWSEILLKWAIVQVNSGRTLPWVTTDAAGVMPPTDLASLSFYHAMMKEDGTFVRTRYAGVKCDSWEIGASDSGEGRVWTLRGTCTGIRPVGNPWDSSSDPLVAEFPDPLETNYPTGPYLFSHLGSGTGTVTVGTNRATSCKSLTIRGTNRMSGNRYTSRFLQTYRYVGRQTSADLVLRYRGTPDDRASWRAQTALDCEFLLDNGSKTVKIDFHANNVLRPWARQLPNDGEYLQALSLANRFSAAAGTDITLTTT
jgi:hypothetical protein